MTDLLTTLALLWRLDRRDGVSIGLTSHDRDLIVDGFSYRAAPGMTPSAIKRQGGLDPSTMDATGALVSGAITQADLLAGRWDGACVTIAAIDWSAPAAPIPLGTGTLGAIEIKDAAFTAELSGGAVALDAPVSEETSASCRAELGDQRCRVAMGGRRRFARVTGAGAALSVDAAEPSANAYGGGLLRWLGGANSGLVSAIAASDGVTVTLRAPAAFAPEIGALVELIEGCDKTIATCAARFANAANFRGEPYLPGTDLLTRYPGA